MPFIGSGRFASKTSTRRHGPLKKSSKRLSLHPPGVHNAHVFCSLPFTGFLPGHPPKESQIRFLYHIHGASSGVAIHFARRPGGLKISVAQQARDIVLGTLPFVFLSPDFEDAYDLITRVEPSLLASRFVYKKTIVSRGVFELLQERRLKR